MTSLPEHPETLSPENNWRTWLLAMLVCAAAALAMVAPFHGRGNASGHDFQFHAASWLDAAEQWKEGVFFPRWAQWANWGFGEPRFVFYPPLSWMLGAALGLTVGWNAAAVAFLFVTQTLAGLCMFALARRTIPLRAALFAGAVYAVNPYAQLVVYLRSDFAELLSAAMLPLVLLFAGDLAEAEEAKAMRRGIALFALPFAWIWLSNAPAGVLASYCTAVLFAGMALAQRSLWPLVRGGLGFALGFGLCAFYLLPAAYEQRWVNIMQALSSGLRPAQNFLYTTIPDHEHNLFNWIASSTAVGMIVLAGLAGIAAHRREEAEEHKRLWRKMMLLTAASTLLMFHFAAPLWSILPKLRFVQFPWRCMLLLAVPFAWFAAASVARRRFGWIGAAALIGVLIAAGSFFVQHAWWDKEDIPVLRAAIARGEGYEGTDEYDPLGDDHTDLPEHAPRVKLLPADAVSKTEPRAQVQVERWTAEEKVFEVNSREPVRAALRVLIYPAWRATVNGSVIQPERAEDSMQMILPLAAGEHRVHVRWTRTPDQSLGAWLTGVSVLFAAALYLRTIPR